MSTTEAKRPWLIARNDTFFGVCEGLGEDLGIHSNWFRLGFALALFFAPLATIATYFAAGVLVASGRFLFRAPKAKAETGLVEVASETQVETETEELPLAA